VIAPVYRPAFFFRDRFGNRQEKEVKWFTGRKASAFVPAAERGTFLTRLQICTRLARAVRRMHFAGLAHADLSNKNVLIDPRTGDVCVIDIDSLVVPGVAPPTVLGTPGYIAPEVLGRGAKPSIDTDKHALAVLIYQILLNRHPLQGRKVNSTRSAEEDERLSMGARAVFVEHPTDRSNSPIHPLQVPMSRLGAHLEALFLRSFVRGLHQPAHRPDAAEWETALYRTLNMVHPTPSGRDWFVLGSGMPRQCPVSGERVHQAVPVAHYLRDLGDRMADERQSLTVFHNLVLHDWHTRPGVVPGEHANRAPRGYFSYHQGRWWMVNLHEQPMEVVGGAAIARNGALELVPGLAVRMPGDEQPRVLRFEFLGA
jgi:serine/threonine protein kinase